MSMYLAWENTALKEELNVVKQQTSEMWEQRKDKIYHVTRQLEAQQDEIRELMARNTGGAGGGGDGNAAAAAEEEALEKIETLFENKGERVVEMYWVRPSEGGVEGQE